MRKFIAIMAIVALVPSIASAQFSKKGTSGAQFLKLGVGSRAIAMGSAFTAIANDASALYWNPAGIARLRKNEAILSYTNWIADITHNYVGFVYNGGDLGNFGISLTALTMGRMEITTIENPQGTGATFGASDYAIGLTYAKNFTNRFSFGIKVKYIRETIWNMAAGGFAYDIGTLYDTGFKNIRIGMNMANFGGEMAFKGGELITQYPVYPEEGNVAPIDAEMITDPFPLPMTFRLGISYSPLRENITTSFDFVKVNDSEEAGNFGFEYRWNRMFSLRAGYQFSGDADFERSFTLGGGFEYKLGTFTAKIDYSYFDFGRLKSVSCFTIGVVF